MQWSFDKILRPCVKDMGDAGPVFIYAIILALRQVEGLKLLTRCHWLR